MPSASEASALSRSLLTKLDMQSNGPIAVTQKKPLAAPAFASCCCASDRQGAKPASPPRRGALQDRRTRTSCGHVVDYLPKTPQ
jgi:hypothetical protein